MSSRISSAPIPQAPTVTSASQSTRGASTKSSKKSAVTGSNSTSPRSIAPRRMTNKAKSKAALTHFDRGGRAHMVDVAAKAESHRVAVASGEIRMQAATLDLIARGKAGKGDVLGIARVAAIQGAKRCADLIPLCHPLALTRVAVDFEVVRKPAAVRCIVKAESVGRTGVEMEALAAVAAGLLTIYDMC